MLAIKRSAGVAPEVNLRIHGIQVMRHASEGTALTLKHRPDITRGQQQGTHVLKKNEKEILVIINNMSSFSFYAPFMTEKKSANCCLQSSSN